MPTITDQNIPAGTGSAFINNTSYSGCDIKVVVHTYGAASLADAEMLAEARDGLDEIRERLTTVESEINKAKLKMVAEALATPAYFNASARYNSFSAEREGLLAQQEATEEIIRTLSKSTSQKTTKTLAEAQTISLSVFRDKQAARACGSVYPKGFTRGPREIAGSIIFTVFNEHVLYEFLRADPADFDGIQFTSAILDQLPPVDITIAFANEFGQLSRMTIYGVEFITEGQTMSIEDLLTENTVNFVARDFDPMRSVGRRKTDSVSHQLQKELALKASDLILETDYQEYRDKLSPFARFYRRRNPFV